jgi:hypothetical protein
VFTAEVVDEQGTSIEATFWREAADRADELLQEGKVGGWPSSRSTYWQAGSLLVAGASGCRTSPLLPAGAPACLLNPPACPPFPAPHLQVYVLGRGNVKPADKRYSRVRNDYALHFDPACEMDSCGALRWACCGALCALGCMLRRCRSSGCRFSMC